MTARPELLREMQHAPRADCQAEGWHLCTPAQTEGSTPIMTPDDPGPSARTAALAVPWWEWLHSLGACRDAVLFAQGYSDLASAWLACERADWLLWLLGRQASDRQSPERRALVLTACQCARRALRFVPTGEMRPVTAIETAERWANQDPAVTLADVRAAADDAANAAARTAEHRAMCVLIRARHACPTPAGNESQS